jgi:tetratricopeptide (TPR) repeat protein
LAAVWSIYLLAETVSKQIELPQYVKYSFYAFVGLALLGFAYGTHTRNEVWKTEETLWKDCAVKSPENGRGLMNYGLALMSRGDYKTAEMYFQRGLDAWPTYSYLHVNMGVLKSALGKSEEAEKFFLSGIQYGGGYPNSHYFYARF